MKTDYNNHPATLKIKEWVAAENIKICTINDVWRKALERNTDVVKNENHATLLDVHKCCKAAGLIKKTVRFEDKVFRVLVTDDYSRSTL